MSGVTARRHTLPRPTQSAARLAGGRAEGSAVARRSALAASPLACVPKKQSTEPGSGSRLPSGGRFGRRQRRPSPGQQGCPRSPTTYQVLVAINQ
eukprot:366462-Chlamydomonas_euryale.AAC.38